MHSVLHQHMFYTNNLHVRFIVNIDNYGFVLYKILLYPFELL